MAVCSMLCTDGLLLHLVGKGQLLVYLGASYGNGKLGDSIGESHHKSSAQGARRANTPPYVLEGQNLNQVTQWETATPVDFPLCMRHNGCRTAV